MALGIEILEGFDTWQYVVVFHHVLLHTLGTC